MRICMLLSSPLPPTEGIGFYVWNLSRQLTAAGHSVELITRGDAGPTRREQVDGVTIWRLPFMPLYPLHVHLHGRFVQGLVRELEPQVDVFHLHTPLPPPITTRRPVLVTFHSPVRDDVRQTPVTSLYTLQMKLQAPVSYGLERQMLRRASAVTAVAPHVASALRGYPDAPHSVAVSWNGVDTATFRPGDAYRSTDELLCVGRLAPGKGVEDLLHALATLKAGGAAARLTLVGEGPLRPAVEELVERLGLGDRVVLAGHVGDRARLAELYRRAAVFVLPSHHEGLPTVLLEAMACGCPVLSTAVGGVPEVVADGENGILVSPTAPEALAAALGNLLARPALRARLGARASHTAVERFSWERVGRGYLEVYSSLVQGGVA